MPSLANRVALVTGSSSGIGRGIAEHFAALGARVLVHGLEVEAGERIAAGIRDRGGDAAFAAGDVADEAVCRGLVRTAVERFGGLDILVNNAGIYTRASVETASVAFWDRMMAINLRAPFILLQAAIEPMRARGGGSIVNIGSINAYVGMASLGPYSVSKGGLMTLTRNAAQALSPHRIRINQLNVGWTLTEGEDRVKREEEGLAANWIEDAGRTRAFGRILTPQDIAQAAAFFASDDSALITGSVLDVEQFAIGAPGTW
jgi:NAD(P)-dependent dehydrogenase (short-subunit alcohol dehydrogenase family)